MKAVYLIAGALVVGFVGMANANQGGMARISFEALDTNGDGKITQAEMDASKKARFAASDANGDGMLSADEMAVQGKERMAKRIGQMIAKRDADGDGMLSLAEMGAGRNGNRLFMRVDTNGDGVVTAEEFAEAKSRRRAHGGGKPASE